MNTLIKYTAIILLILASVIIPDKIIMHNDLSLCVFNMTTGYQCPLCGMTRGVFEMMHFRFLSSIGYNPLAVFLPAMLVIDIIFDFTHNNSIRKIRKIAIIMFLAGLAFLFMFRLWTG